MSVELMSKQIQLRTDPKIKNLHRNKENPRKIKEDTKCMKETNCSTNIKTDF